LTKFIIFSDDEPTTSPQLPIKNSRNDQSSKKMTRHRRRNNKERDEAKYANIIPVENGPADDSRWPHFSNEDYIVFCFRENGGFDVVKETSRPVNRKVGSNSTDLAFFILKVEKK
jgi:hypothetical protein